jgi:AcrR family transcriptional regulator
MDVEARREQLLATGVALFGDHPFDEVEISDIARAAGVSRGLLYRYFPDKASFFVAVVARQLDALAEATRTDPADPPGTRLRAGLDAYFGFVDAQPEWYRSIYRSAASGHPAVQDLVERAHARQAERVLEFFPALDPTPLRRVAAHGWIAFLATAGLARLDGAPVPHDELRGRCIDVLFAALGTEPPPEDAP